MIRSLKGFFRRLWVSKPPAFQYLQVEVTSRCDLPGCLMCPRRAWPEHWLHHGATAETFERLRPGADFQRVTQQVAALCARRRALARSRPEVVLLFMKMRPNIAELPDFLRLAAALGVDRVNATNLDFVAAPAMAGLTLVSSEPDPEMATIFEQAQRQAEKFRLPFRNVGSKPVSDLIWCDANPLKNVLVTAAGDLSPCVYLGLPLAGTFSRQFFQKSYPAQNYLYGNIEVQELSEIFQQPGYQEFTAFFRKRATTNSDLMDHLVPNPQAPIRPGRGGKNHPVAAPWFPWPPPCQGCYKSLGF